MAVTDPRNVGRLRCCAALAVFVATLPATASDAEGLSSPNTPSITIAEGVIERNPAAFARRLGELLGVEVRLPGKGFQKLSLPAGEWTAPRLLAHVARQIEDASWSEIIELRTRVKGRPAAPPVQSKLPLTGKVTLRAEGWAYERVVRSVEEAAPCSIRMPNGIPPGRYRMKWENTPLDRVLEDLAAAGGMRVTRVIVFQRSDEAQAEAMRLQEERQTRETLQQGEVANRLEELYGADAYSEDFSWDNIDRATLSASLGRELGIDVATVETLLERIRLEGLTRRSE